MLKNYLNIALRNLRKNKIYSFINIFGLAIGIACFIVIGLYVYNELSYDRYHKNADKIYRVGVTLKLNGITYDEASIPFPAAEVLQSDFPEVKNSFRLFKEVLFPLVKYGDYKFSEQKFYFADKSIFEVMDFEFVKGNPTTALEGINSVVITESTAEKYFGKQDPIGKTLLYENESELIVTGVIKDVKSNSHFTFDFMASLNFMLKSWDNDWGVDGRHRGWLWTGAWTYLQLNDENSVKALSRKLPGFIDKYFPERYKTGAKLNLQPISDIHLYSALDNELEQNSSILYVYIFLTVAFFILFIACINFINLSIAQSNNRANEVGVRKVLGAHKSQLIFQFLGETIISSFLAMLLALALVELITPLFNELLEKPLSISLYNNYYGIPAICLITILTGVISGIFPALFLSNFSPVKIFKKNIGLNFSNEFLRKALVTLQFSISVFLIIAIGIIYQQLGFINSKKLGFDKEKVLFVKSRNDVDKKFDALRNELLKNNSVVNVSATTDIPGKGANSIRFVPEGFSRNDPLMLPISQVSYEFFETMDIKIIEGRSFSRKFPSDVKEAFILNKKAIENIGWKDDPVGKKFEMFAAGKNEIGMSGYIIGVVDDYHFESLHTEVKPLVLNLTNNYTYYVIRLDEGDLSSQIDLVENTWKKFSPDWPFEFFFLDKNLEQSYNNDKRLGKLINYFTLLAIFIACMGLFGLVTFAAEKRSKEIGIRKVLGASVSSIIKLLSADFVKIVLTANIIAWPVAYYFMDKWLQSFAYRINIGWWVFVLAGGIALLIALATVSYQAIKAATINPVESLRYE